MVGDPIPKWRCSTSRKRIFNLHCFYILFQFSPLRYEYFQWDLTDDVRDELYSLTTASLVFMVPYGLSAAAR
jgi:hypothetical protein